MKNLWAPWRMEYINSKKREGCVFCVRDLGEEDKERRVVYRAGHSFVIMNIYPYNNGHLMAAPYEHIPCLTRLTDEIMFDLFRTTRLCVEVLRKVYNPEGFNTGMNIGAAAGAGFEEHLHVHVVPRWRGDCNFMPVLADTRVLPEHLDVTYGKIKAAFEETGREE